MEATTGFKTSQGCTREVLSSEDLALCLIQADKGLSNSTCAGEHGGDNDGFYLAKVGITFILGSKSVIVYNRGTTVQFIS